MDPGITLLGLGPGDPHLLTLQAWEVLNNIPEIYLRTDRHPAVSGFPAGLRVHSFDQVYEQNNTFEEIYIQIVDRILALAERSEGVVYAVPGHPFIAETTTLEIAKRAGVLDIPIRIVDGLSFIEPALSLLGVDPFPRTMLLDALELARAHHPPFPPDAPALIAQIHSKAIATDVKLTLMSVYPDEHSVKLVHGAGTRDAIVEDLRLFEIDRDLRIGLLTCLYLPPLGEKTSFESFQDLVAHLRAPEGCPWDREQTHLSLRPFLLEEAYEVLDALNAEDSQAASEELGDLLLQIVLHAQIAGEAGEFTMADILQKIHSKLVRRHPHVFGDLVLNDAREVLEHWERWKNAERSAHGEETRGLLQGVSVTLPALSQAEAYQKRAAKLGLEWTESEAARKTLGEELTVLEQAGGNVEREREFGELLFGIVDLARRHQVDAESALRGANARFRQRFTSIEESLREEGKQVMDLSHEELKALWEDQDNKPGNSH
jgi:tetrapyrrole methylase family protein/MazG family protein